MHIVVKLVIWLVFMLALVYPIVAGLPIVDRIDITNVRRNHRCVLPPIFRRFIAACDCFVLPSWHEGMANTNLECAAMGRPVITTNIHGCLEAV